MEDAASGDHETVPGFGFLDPKGDVALGFAGESIADLARRDVFAFLPRERAVVDGEEHADRGLFDRDGGERFAIVGVRDRIADLDLAHARDRAEVSGENFVGRLASERFEREELLHALGFGRAVRSDDHDRHALLDSPGQDPADADSAHVVVVFEGRHLHTEGGFDVALGGVDFLDDEIEQGGDVGAVVVRVEAGVAVARRRVHRGELELLVVRLELEEELEDLVEDLVGAAVRPVDLVEDDEDPVVHVERLAQDEPGLRHRPLERVDEQEDAVGHAQDALDLASEVGVAGSVDQVDLHALPADRDVLGEDRDPALSFERIGVEHLFFHALVRAEDSGVVEHPVHEGRLAVVDVRDDRDVSDTLSHTSSHGGNGVEVGGPPRPAGTFCQRSGRPPRPACPFQRRGRSISCPFVNPVRSKALIRPRFP